MLTRTLILVAVLLSGYSSPAAASCGPEALGTARTLTLSPKDGAKYGAFHYARTPLQPGEVVLTFDDGPRPETTPQVLAALKAECVTATFFMVGTMVEKHPELARTVAAEGHTVGLHANVHTRMSELPVTAQNADWEAGWKTLRMTLGEQAQPVYRFPEFRHSPELLARAEAEGVAVLSADASPDDWVGGETPEAIVAHTLESLKKAGGSGVLLLHNYQPSTAVAMPALLSALKANGYRVVNLSWR